MMGDTAPPLQALILDEELHVFLVVADNQAPMPTVNKDQLFEVIAIFHPGLRLHPLISEDTLLQLFNLLVRPFFHHMEGFDKESNVMLYWRVSLWCESTRDRIMLYYPKNILIYQNAGVGVLHPIIWLSSLVSFSGPAWIISILIYQNADVGVLLSIIWLQLYQRFYLFWLPITSIKWLDHLFTYAMLQLAPLIESEQRSLFWFKRFLSHFFPKALFLFREISHLALCACCLDLFHPTWLSFQVRLNISTHSQLFMYRSTTLIKMIIHVSVLLQVLTTSLVSLYSQQINFILLFLLRLTVIAPF